MYQYRPQNEDELELREGDRVDVMQQCDDGWFVGAWPSRWGGGHSSAETLRMPGVGTSLQSCPGVHSGLAGSCGLWTLMDPEQGIPTTHRSL